MKARKGFIATSFAVFFAMLLGLIAVYAISIGVGTVNEEARMTLQAERSLYPMAWSAANAVLQHLKEDHLAIPTSPPISDDFDFTVATDKAGVYVKGVVWGNRTSGVRVITGATRADSTDRVNNVRSNDIILSSDVVVRGFLSPDATIIPPWTIVWR